MRTLRPGTSASQMSAPVVAGRDTRGSARPGLSGLATPLPLVAHQAALLPVPIALLLGLALVVQLLALGEAEQDLGDPTLVEIELERHDRHPLPLDRARQPIELALVHQELAWPRWLMRVAPALRVFGDMRVDQIERAAAFVRRVGIADIRLAGSQRLHFRAGEHEASLKRVLDREVEAGLAVFGDELAALALLRHRLDLAVLNEEQADFGKRCVDLGLGACRERGKRQPRLA